MRLLYGAATLCAVPLVLSSTGCEAPGRSLTVRVQSGLRAGHEVRYVEAAVFTGSVACDTTSAPRSEHGLAVTASDQQSFGAGTLTAGTFEGLPAGLYTVRATFRRPPADSAARPDSGAVLVDRCLVTTLTADRVVRIALTTDCLAVECPAPDGSEAFSQCLNGRCVDPRCDPDDPSTAAYCCDRATLGALCDAEPTLCARASDCAPTVSCSGAPRCEGGICVEPDDDACEEGAYCDAEADSCRSEPSPPPDAGTPDGGVVDAGPRRDAPGLDVGTGGVTGEDCVLVSDEDGDGLSDCADPECFGSAVCTIPGCAPIPRPARPTASIPEPLHWYRADHGVFGSAGEVCALADLIATDHFVTDAELPPHRDVIGDGDAVLVSASERLYAARTRLGLGFGGDYSVVVVSQRATGAGSAFPAFRGWLPTSDWTFLELQTHFAPRNQHRLVMLLGVFEVGSAVGTGPTLETVLVAPLSAGDDLRDRVAYYRNGTVIGLSLFSGSPIVPAIDLSAAGEGSLGPGTSGSIRVGEVLTYDHALTESERLQVETYLSDLYGIVSI
ncbi:MAG: hypothetical protein U0353_33230 [Sandaracinus sp.]